jgi:cell division protein ZapA (FtsZ GTPase activity inhibitor)
LTGWRLRANIDVIGSMKTVSVNILDCEYRIRTSEAGEAVLGVAREVVDSRMREVRKQYPHQPLAQTAVIACLDLVGEFLEEEQRKNGRAKARLQLLIDKLDRI